MPESASPPSTEIADLIGRLIARTAGQPIEAVAAIVGVDASYISKWRNNFRPTRMGRHALSRLRRGVEDLESPDGSVRSAAMRTEAERDAIGFAAGVLWSIERDARHIAETARLARAKLGYDEKSVTPSAGAVARGLDALGRVEASPAPVVVAKKRRRGG